MTKIDLLAFEDTPDRHHYYWAMILRAVGLKHFSAAATKSVERRELDVARKKLLKARAATANRAIPKDPLADFCWEEKQRLAFLNKLLRAHRRR